MKTENYLFVLIYLNHTVILAIASSVEICDIKEVRPNGEQGTGSFGPAVRGPDRLQEAGWGVEGSG